MGTAAGGRHTLLVCAVLQRRPEHPWEGARRQVASCSVRMGPVVLGGPGERHQLHWVFRQLKPGKGSFVGKQL